MTEPGMLNVYCPKIKLRAAAHQAIYVLIFRKFSSYYKFYYETDVGFLREGSVQSRYIRPRGGQRPPHPPWCACVELPNPTFWQRNLSSLK